jgi:DNA processing protein
MSSRSLWIGLSLLPGLGPKTFRALLTEFGSPEAILSAPDPALLAFPRINDEMLAALRKLPEQTEMMEAELDSLADEGVTALTWLDAAYPPRLRPVEGAPPVLWLAGPLCEQDADGVAIVGSRLASQPGLELARTLAGDLAQRAITVVSGLAEGIDRAAHEGALAAGGRTLGILGCGLRRIPASIWSLGEPILEQGALLSEQPPNAPLSAGALLARDRIVSGISRAVIVIEARPASGTLDTADHARRQGRTLLVANWPDRQESYQGNVELLAEGGLPFSPDHEGVKTILAALESA